MMCEKNEARIKELKDFSQHTTSRLFDIQAEGIIEGSQNEREAFLEWLKDFPITNNRWYKIQDKIKELEGKE